MVIWSLLQGMDQLSLNFTMQFKVMKYFLVLYAVHVCIGSNRPGRQVSKSQISLLVCEVLPALSMAAHMQIG